MILAGLDTNILLYAADNAGDAEKHRIAVDLLGRLSAVGRGLLPLQALTEFYAVAVRKQHVPPERASLYVDTWGDVFPTREAVFADVVDAMRVHREHGIQFWDGMMWSVTKRAGARFLLSEDFQDGRELEGVRFLNPLAPTNLPVLEDALRL
jgi:predicted nucleic acid-binding protein